MERSAQGRIRLTHSSDELPGFSVHPTTWLRLGGPYARAPARFPRRPCPRGLARRMRDKDSSLVKLPIAQSSEPDFLRPQSRCREKGHEEPGHDSRPSFDSLCAPEQPVQVLIVEDPNRSRDSSREPDVPLAAE